MARGIHHFLLLAACTGCGTPRPPDLEHAVDTAWGTVHAARRADALEIALVVERVAPRVAAAIPDRRDAAIDIRLVPALEQDHWGGATITTEDARWIELPEDARDASAQAILAHELAHWWLGDVWDALPPVLEEGVAIQVSHLAVTEAAARERGELALVLGTLIDGSVAFTGPGVVREPGGPKLTTETVEYRLHARVDADELPILSEIFTLESDELAGSTPPGARAVLDALAYVVVERVGIEKLHRLCQQARLLGRDRIPSAWIWSAARIDPEEPVSLDRAVRELLGTAEIRALLLREDLRLWEDPGAGRTSP